MASSLGALLLAAGAAVGRAQTPVASPAPVAEPAMAAATDFSPFPGYAGPLRVGGSLYINKIGPSQMALAYTMFGLDSGCDAAVGELRNGGCMLQIRRGKNCTDVGAGLAAETFSTQQYRAADGWATEFANITATAPHVASLASHAIVLTDRQGSPFACSPIEAFSAGPEGDLMVLHWERYPGYQGELEVHRSATVMIQQVNRTRDALPGQVLTLIFDGGLDPACGAKEAASIAAADACGIHVHEGAECHNAGGHFWDKTMVEQDPWAKVRYHPGVPVLLTAPVSTGLTREQLRGRTLVVHDATGARTACAQIDTFTQEKQPAEGSEAPRP